MVDTCWLLLQKWLLNTSLHPSAVIEDGDRWQVSKSVGLISHMLMAISEYPKSSSSEGMHSKINVTSTTFVHLSGILLTGTSDK